MHSGPSLVSALSTAMGGGADAAVSDGGGNEDKSNRGSSRSSDCCPERSPEELGMLRTAKGARLIYKPTRTKTAAVGWYIWYTHDADFPGADPAGRYGDKNTDGDNRDNGGAGATGANMMLTSLASRAIASIHLLRNLKNTLSPSDA